MDTVKIMAPAREKECGICGKVFAVTNALQKYCPECRTGSDRKLAWMSQNIEMSKRRYGNGQPPQPKKCFCGNCGKKFDAYIHVKKFCSKKCEQEYILKHTICSCGKSRAEATDDGIISPHGVWFCCEEHMYQHARDVGAFKVCPCCGKEFFFKNTTYCSKECYKKDLPRISRLRAMEKAKPESICKECGKEYLKADAKKSMFNIDGFCSIGCRRKFYEKTMTGTMSQCVVCGTDFFRSANENIFSCCSEECARKERANFISYQNRQSEERAAKIQLIKEEAAKRKEEKRKKREEQGLAPCAKRKSGPRQKPKYKDASAFDPEWIKKNGLCGICRTPYKDCTWMQTKFRVKPEGALYENSKIVVCPFFKG